MRKMLTIFIMVITGCNFKNEQKTDHRDLKNAKTISTFKASSDMNNSYFILKEGNYFEFYKSLYDSIKNTHFAGKYSLNGDTLILNFFDNKGEEIFGNRAIINTEKNKIYFFNSSKEAKQMHLFN